MKHIQTLETRDMAKSLLNGGCGECQTMTGIAPYTVGADSISARGRPPHCTITKRRKP